MNSDEILEEWGTDAPISQTELTKASREIPVLHHKYATIYANEKRLLNRMKIALKKLKAQKQEFLANPTQEDYDRGWKYPDRKLLKNEHDGFLRGDNDLLKAELKVLDQEDKVAMLQDILGMIRWRHNVIKEIREERDYLAGR